MIAQRFVRTVVRSVLLLVIGGWVLAKDVRAADYCSETFWPSCWSQCYDATCGTNSGGCTSTSPGGCGICCDDPSGYCGPYGGCYYSYDTCETRNCNGAASWCTSEFDNNCACSVCLPPPLS